MVLYLSIIFIAMALIVMGNILWNPQSFENFEVWLMLVVTISVVAEFVIDGIFAGIIHAMPDKWFAPEKKMFQVGKRERNFYEKMGIKSWKDKVWELGALGGFRKNKIKDPNSPEYLRKFLIESNIGFIIHYVGMFVGFGVIFILPMHYALTIGLWVALVNAVLNLLPTMILRYNVPKLSVAYKRAIRLRERKETVNKENIVISE